MYAGPNNDGNGAMPINDTVAKEAQWAGYTGPNFTDLNAELKTDPTKAWDSVPQDIKDEVDACIQRQRHQRPPRRPRPAATRTTTTAADAATSTTGA